MSLFFNYDKEGKGIEKNAPEKNIVFAYFESFARNLGSLIKSNFLYVIASIPMLLIFTLLFVGLIYPNIGTALANLAADSENALETEALYVGAFLTAFASGMLLLIGSGPASAAFAYAAKCMANEEHVWIWSDFKKQFGANFKQSMIVAVVDVIVSAAAIYAMLFYSAVYTSTGNKVYLVFFAIMGAVSLLYCAAHVYIYQFMVTFDSKLSVIYKNAFIMALAKLPQNVLLLLIAAVPTYMIFTTLNPIPSVVLLTVIWYSLLRYPTEFYAARNIRKIINQKSKGNEA